MIKRQMQSFHFIDSKRLSRYSNLVKILHNYIQHDRFHLLINDNLLIPLLIITLLHLSLLPPRRRLHKNHHNR